MLMSVPGCAEFRVHHLARHQRLTGSIVIAPSNPRLPESISKMNRPRFYAHFLCWQGWRDAEQVRREHQGQGGTVGP